MPVEPAELTFATRTFINFRQYRFPTPYGHGFRWVDIKHLRLRPPSRVQPPSQAPGDRALLSALIAHEQFRDDYAGGGVQPDGTRHGPYWLRTITPDAYDTVSRNDSERILRDWTEEQDAPAALLADLQREAYDPLTAADRILHLRELGDEATHDWGRVHQSFHEFVLLDRAAGRITLLVAADD